MEPKDVELLNTLSESNDEISRLMSEHADFEVQLKRLNKRRAFTPQQEAEMNRIKKLKLQGRDRIEAILAEHRT